MSQSDKNLVLAGIDGSAISAAVADYAAWIANTVGVPLKLLHNLEHREPPAAADLSGNIGLGSREHLLEELTELEAKRSKILLEQGKHMLEAANERAKAAGVEEAILCQRNGSLTETLVEMEEHIRVLVLGVRGEDHQSDDGLGHHIESIIRALHKPILIVNQDFAEPQRIMLAYDGSEAAEKALDYLLTSPLYEGMDCHLVHVTKDDAKADELLENASERLQKAGLNVVTAKLHGDAEQQLLSYQQEQDIQMIVMGSFGHGRLREMLLGSFTLKMLNRASIPLLLLR
ncbi:universal stress protein [Lacimicrobium alkaliphilum]|uniref:Universal stress protein A n=1 Tax=Lacimicrobium alkaliphilum TaxID=1526571 RepID=A0ABQ1REP9_9ALTE|nr:universal stress protein [Lacimicrobium alkaliphilum]GGD65543.1 universal stress protein A [Lacimicrobium alkaliphilum]